MTPNLPIYLDHAATTPCDPRVIEAMMPYFTETFGNPGSRNHSFGWAAEDGIETARRQVADLLGADRKEVIFTSGATESNNLAIKGAANMYAKAPAGQSGRGHIITCAIEHKATLDPCKRLEKEGFDVTYLDPGPKGFISKSQVEQALRDETILVSLMWANNEVGAISEIPEIGKLCHDRGVILHTDATQWVGKMPTDVNEANVDLLSLSAHKLYGPKGVGALYVRRRRPRVRLTPLSEGGGQERGFRSGTLNVTGIVGLGAACEIAGKEMATEAERLGKLRDQLEQAITERLDTVQVNGDPERRLPHITNISFGFVEGESMMMACKELAMSSGSACTSASLEPSYVLKNMGVGDDLAHSSLRISLGRFTTEQEVTFAADKICEAVEKLRALSPLYDMHNEGIDITKIEWQAH
ncbi:MAG: IscS subfamily cysteine desulfurase [Planctomycetota bacterium]